MKKTKFIWQAALLASSTVVLPSDNNQAEDSFLNHLTFSGRVGLNITAQYGPRVTSGGDAYNYLDGYVLPDSSGGFDPTGTYPSITHYWGYDNSARQVNDSTFNAGNYSAALPNNSVLFTRSSGGGDLGTRAFDDDPRLGLELSYDRELGTHGKWRYGVELAINYMNLCLRESGTANGLGTQTAYSYVFNGRSLNAPPLVYAGTSDVIIGSSNFEIGNVATAVGNSVPVSVYENNRLDADILGFRAGPYLQHPLGKRGDIRFSGGLAAVFVNASGSWSQQSTINGIAGSVYSGSGSGSDLLWGWYAGANASYHLSKRWDVTAGVQFQDTDTFRKNFGGRQVEIDLSKSVYITVGVSYKF